jgi:hypothetical protein
LLAAEFRGKVKACHYQKMTTLPRDPNGKDTVVKIIQDKIYNQQTILRMTARKRTQAGHLLYAEFREIISKETKVSLLRTWHSQRRNNMSRPGYRDSALTTDPTMQL